MVEGKDGPGVVDIKMTGVEINEDHQFALDRKIGRKSWQYQIQTLLALWPNESKYKGGFGIEKPEWGACVVFMGQGLFLRHFFYERDEIMQASIESEVSRFWNEIDTTYGKEDAPF